MQEVLERLNIRMSRETHGAVAFEDENRIDKIEANLIRKDAALIIPQRRLLSHATDIAKYEPEVANSYKRYSVSFMVYLPAG